MSSTPVGSSQSSQATTALVLGIVSIVCCQILGPVAWFLGHQELQKIRNRQSSAAGEGFAKAGMILGIVGTVLLVLTLFWFIFAGGIAMIGALSER
jgi:hypothetical protein